MPRVCTNNDAKELLLLMRKKYFTSVPNKVAFNRRLFKVEEIIYINFFANKN